MAAWDADEAEVLAFLRTVIKPENAPVFVHCRNGSDRTGTMVAAYRVVVQGWSKEAAIREMRDGPFGFHLIWGCHASSSVWTRNATGRNSAFHPRGAAGSWRHGSGPAALSCGSVSPQWAGSPTG